MILPTDTVRDPLPLLDEDAALEVCDRRRLAWLAMLPAGEEEDGEDAPPDDTEVAVVPRPP